MMREAPDVPLPVEFFDRILVETEELPELKVVLHTSYLAARQGTPAVALDDLLAADVVRSVAGSNSPEPGELRLIRAVDRAVANGSLLRVSLQVKGQTKTLLLLASAHNRGIVDRLRVDDPSVWDELDLEPGGEVTLYRPNVFGFYERHIGPLTPLIAEQLRDAERSYPRSWIEQAILTAVDYNKRNWRYVQTILTRWEETGAPDGSS